MEPETDIDDLPLVCANANCPSHLDGGPVVLAIHPTGLCQRCCPEQPTSFVECAICADYFMAEDDLDEGPF